MTISCITKEAMNETRINWSLIEKFFFDIMMFLYSFSSTDNDYISSETLCVEPNQVDGFFNDVT